MLVTRLFRTRPGRGAIGIGLLSLVPGVASAQPTNVAPYPSLGMAGMAVANNRIYYGTGVFAQEFCTAFKQVFSLSTTGTPGAALLDSTAPGGCSAGLMLTNLVPSGAHVYMGMGHSVQRVFALGGEVTETVFPVTTITPNALAVDQFRVYVESPDDVLTAYPRDGGAAVGSIIATGLVGGSGQNFTAPGDGFVYYIANGNIFRWNGTSGAAQTLESSATVANIIWVDATDVWWVGAGASQTIGRIPVGGGANAVRHTTLAGTDIFAMTGDATNIYFMADPPGGGQDVIRRLPRTTTVATDVNDVSASNSTRILCQDEQFLYWAEFGGASPGIKKNLKNATIARPDLFWGQDRIEVIQAVQDNVNSVQLIANRPAMARVYPQATQLLRGVTASLEGTTTGGVPLPGSPIRAVSLSTDCNTTLPDRGEFTRSFNFILPDSWTTATGSTTSIRLRAIIDPANFVAESNELNNQTSQQTFLFRKTPTLVLDCRRVLTHGGDYTMGEANFGEIILRAHSMIPWSKVTVREIGGRLEEWEPTLFHPTRHGPWELNGKHWECAWLCDEDGFVNFELGLEWVGSEISNLLGESVVNHRMGMVHGNDDWNWGGLAPPLPPILLVKMSGGEDFNQPDRPYGGNALAHELTHNWGYKHVNCGSGFRGGFDEHYPYDKCAMGHSDTDATRTIAYDWLKRKFYDAPDLNSYMSYEDNGWTEPYHWNGILGFGVPRGGGMPPSTEALMVNGMYDPITGAATITNAVRFDRTTVGAGNLDSLWNMQDAGIADSTLTLNLQLLNSLDQPVDAVIVPVARPCCALHSDPRPFNAIAPCSAVVRGLRVTPNTAADGTPTPPSAIFRASAASPTVSVTSPAAGTTFTAAQNITVNWTASDADGDQVKAMIQYSRDAGATWNVVANVGNLGSYTFTPADRLAASTSLAGNGSSQFRVIVTDGFNTSSGLSPSFKVPNRAPVVQFVAPQAGSVIPASEQILLEVLASDPEDIELSTYSWTYLHNGVTTTLGGSTSPRFLISNGLAPGTYTFSCLPIDSSFAVGLASVTVTIGNDFVAPPPDSDGDGFADSIDLCPDVASATNIDTDGDGVGDACDKCPVLFNLNQADRDLDGIGDDCDPCPLGQVASLGVDGTAEPAYGAAVAVQNTSTSAGDSTAGDENNSSGSELDNIHAFIDCDRLFIHIAGNLAIGLGDSLDIFIDSTAGGQNKLRAGNPAGVAGLSEVTTGTAGLTFDAAFSPDHWIGLTNVWQVLNVTAALQGTYCPLTASGSNPAQVNLGQAQAYGSGLFTGGAASNLGIRATIDNSNRVGVAAGTGAGSGANAIFGVELSIPLSSIGAPPCDIKVFAMLRDTTGTGGGSGDTLTNQTLPGIGGGAALGTARNVNFGSIAGNQFVTLSRPVVGAAAADIQPAALGRKLTVSARVSAPAPYTAQWLRNGSNVTDSFRITGATTPELIIDPARQSDLGTYALRVSTACGTFTSAGAVVTFCFADYNESGTVSVQDIFDFLADYFVGNLRADFNGSGALSVQDIFDFLAAYFAGCA